MLLRKRSLFSPDDKYFACFVSDDTLTVWEISSNICIIDYKFDSNIYGICNSLQWIPLHHKNPSPKKAKLQKRSHLTEDWLLALGTNKGDIILYNITSKNLFSHLVARHSDAINDMCFSQETDSFITCSSDKSIAIWDVISGKQKSQWVADDGPVTSICLLDGNNMLSSSTSILWWNISEKSVVKKFNRHSNEIFKLLPVNVELSLSSCYFLSGAISDKQINAWSLSSDDSKTSVATFIASGQLEDMDISKVSSKDKHIILSVVTKEGLFNLFDYTLNGNVNQSVYPKLTVEIAPKMNSCDSGTAPIISTKVCSDFKSCIIAHGNLKENIVFKHIKIKESLKEFQLENSAVCKAPSEDASYIKESDKYEKSSSLNGLKSPKPPGKNSKGVRLKEDNPVAIKSHTHVVSSKQYIAPSSLETLNMNTEKCHGASSPERMPRSKMKLNDIDVKDPNSCVHILIEGLQTQNEDFINVVLQNSDTELISNCVKNLPLCTLKYVLQELNRRLKHCERYSSVERIWLTEVLRIHLNYITRSGDIVEILGPIKEALEAKKVNETISKMSALKSLLSLQIQGTSEDGSDSESERMES